MPQNETTSPATSSAVRLVQRASKYATLYDYALDCKKNKLQHHWF